MPLNQRTLSLLTALLSFAVRLNSVARDGPARSSLREVDRGDLRCALGATQARQGRHGRI